MVSLGPGGAVGDADERSGPAEQIDAVLARAVQRGEPVPERELLIDRVVAPIMYRILFRPGRLEAA